MIPAPAADNAFANARDLGDCARILRERFPDSTSEERIEATRGAQSRVIEKRSKSKKTRKKWWLETPEAEPTEPTEPRHPPLARPRKSRDART
jgi:hypothetical protein